LDGRLSPSCVDAADRFEAGRDTSTFDGLDGLTVAALTPSPFTEIFLAATDFLAATVFMDPAPFETGFLGAGFLREAFLL
jgi:hypothetical protein